MASRTFRARFDAFRISESCVANETLARRPGTMVMEFQLEGDKRILSKGWGN